MFSLAKVLRYSAKEVLQLPISRRKRALRWIEEVGKHESAQAKGETASLFTDDFIDYVWGAGDVVEDEREE
jgi:hypothetical protein